MAYYTEFKKWKYINYNVIAVNYKAWLVNFADPRGRAV